MLLFWGNRANYYIWYFPNNGGPRSDETLQSFQEARQDNALKRQYDQVAEEAAANCDLEIRKTLAEVAKSDAVGLTASEYELLVKLLSDQSKDGTPI